MSTVAVAPPVVVNPLTPGDFSLSERDLTPFLGAFMVESLLFGVHATLFFICVRILLRGRKSRVKTAMLTAAMVMFAVAMVDVAFSWNIVLRQTSILYTGTTIKIQKALQAKFIMHLINNAIADFLLLTRCYVVWGNRKIILFIGVFGLITGTACGIITVTLLKKSNLVSIYVSIVLGFNFILTALTAGRIMWVAKEVRKALGPQMASYYKFSAGILVESGMIYTISILLLIVFGQSMYMIVVTTIVVRIVCIVPILIIVQIAVGQSIGDVQTTVTRLQGGTQQVVLDTMVSQGYDAEGQGSHEQFEDEEMSQRRTSIGLRAITPTSSVSNKE